MTHDAPSQPLFRWIPKDEERWITHAQVSKVCNEICEPEVVQDEIKHFFKRFDRFNKGAVSLAAFKQVLRWEAATYNLTDAEQLFMTFEEPSSSKLSFQIAVGVMLLILASSAGFILETEKAFKVRRMLSIACSLDESFA